MVVKLVIHALGDVAGLSVAVDEPLALKVPEAPGGRPDGPLSRSRDPA
jgi:hypothetical protein